MVASSRFTQRRVTSAKAVLKEGGPVKSTRAVATKSDVQRAKSALCPLLAKALSWITDYLTVNRPEILICKANLEAGDMRVQAEYAMTTDVADPSKAETMPDFWHKTYTSMKSVPKYYWADWLQKKTALTADTIDMVDTMDSSQGLRICACFVAGVWLNTWWAPATHERVVLTHWLTDRKTKLGDREATLLRAISKTGGIDETIACVCSFTWSLDVSEWPADLETVEDDDAPYIKMIKHNYFNCEVLSKFGNECDHPLSPR